LTPTNAAMTQLRGPITFLTEFRGMAGLTFAQVRAIDQEMFAALLFAAKPRYLHWMEQATRELQLRI
jgi:hypothetical protein